MRYRKVECYLAAKIKGRVHHTDVDKPLQKFRVGKRKGMYGVCHLGFILFYFILFIFCLFRASPIAYGGSQARC